MLCVKDCPAKAIGAFETERVKVAGRTLEWGKFDALKCSYGYSGGVKFTNPFLAPDADENDWNKEFYGGKERSQYEKWRGAYGNHPAICGGRGCLRACMVHLEKKGVLKNQFKSPFRKRKPWRL
jgi:epoxyqueuosine reductase